MTYQMYLDDIHSPKTEGWVIVRSVKQAKRKIRQLGYPCFISFDHDLGGTSPNGKDLANWLVEQDMDDPWMVRVGFRFDVHSKNCIGRTNIREFLKPYLTKIGLLP